MKSEYIPSLTCADSSEWRPVPVTILTGFLGAGKSTLMSHILTSPLHGKRIAVIMNEMGPSASVDRATIYNRMNESSMEETEWLEVENGCLCCTAKNETFLALESLLQRKRGMIDRVVIEASGAADPAELVEKLWVDEGLESVIVLDAVVCVVDAGHVRELLNVESEHYSFEAARQVAIADCILINKVDTLPNVNYLENLKLFLKEMNPIAKLIETEYSQCSLDEILSIGEYIPIMKGVDSEIRFERNIDQLIEQASKISFKSHLNPEGIRSFTVNLKRPIPIMIFENWLFNLLWEGRINDTTLQPKDQILRIKGLIGIFINGVVKTHTLQVVRNKYDLEPLRKDNSFSINEPALIFIGKISCNSQQLITDSLSRLSHTATK